MVELNNKVKHLVGKEYYDDKFGKSNSVTKSVTTFKRKHILYSKKIKTTDRVCYVEVRKHFFFNYVDFVFKCGKERKYTEDLNKATFFPKLPTKLKVPTSETFPNMKHFIVAIPIKQWKATTDKFGMLNHFYPKKYYPDLYPS